MLDAEDLLVKLNSGLALEAAELQEVVALLESTDVQELGRKLSTDDVYSLILVVGRTKLTGYRSLLERYLDAKDALTVSLVLEILCLQWGPIEECLEWLLGFALGMAWDSDDDVRHTAIRIIGEYLHKELPRATAKSKSRKKDFRAFNVLELMLSLFDDAELDRTTRQAAYFALLRAAGKSWEQLPSEFARLDFSREQKDIDWEVIDAVRALPGDAIGTAGLPWSAGL